MSVALIVSGALAIAARSNPGAPVHNVIAHRQLLGLAGVYLLTSGFLHRTGDRLRRRRMILFLFVIACSRWAELWNLTARTARQAAAELLARSPAFPRVLAIVRSDQAGVLRAEQLRHRACNGETLLVTHVFPLR